ncbi:MAG: hypothetical protein FOGNACKC_00801 [Anaerolineae bacterium]|nr:hypothetical protein [Anaerolineae bacterium]
MWEAEVSPSTHAGAERMVAMIEWLDAQVRIQQPTIMAMLGQRLTLPDAEWKKLGVAIEQRCAVEFVPQHVLVEDAGVFVSDLQFMTRAGLLTATWASDLYGDAEGEDYLLYSVGPWSRYTVAWNEAIAPRPNVFEDLYAMACYEQPLTQEKLDGIFGFTPDKVKSLVMDKVLAEYRADGTLVYIPGPRSRYFRKGNE